MKYKGLALDRLSLLALLALMIGSIHLQAQNSNEPKEVTSTYLLRNAHITTQPGQSLFGSVLIKDGLIEQVGTTVIAPYDAQVIDMDSMYIYAGFIDALSHVGLKEKDKENTPKVKDPGNPPNAAAGITPEHSVYNDFSSKEGSVKKLRELGFGIAHIAPQGRMLPGKGAIFLLGEGEASNMVIQKEASMFSQLKSARRIAPATTIGVMAKYRDIYRNAMALNSYSTKYNNQPNGMRRAQSSPSIESFVPVVNQQLPVYFIANKALDVSRVISLQKELGFKLVLSDVKQAWTMKDKISQGRYSLLLSMDLPDPIKDEKKKDEKNQEDLTEEERQKIKEDQDKAEAKKKKEEAKLSILEKANAKALAQREERKNKSIQEHEAQAAVMEKEGIDFSFSTISTKSGDIRKNIRRMIEAGLTENTALAALTTHPAKLLGISKIAGTIERGKIANLVVSDQPYFNEKSSIRYVFVDGQVNELKKKDDKKGKVAKGAGEALVGDWKYSIVIPGQTRGGVIRITSNADDISVSLSSDESPNDFTDADALELDDDNLKFELTVDNDGFQMELAFDLEIEDNSMNGTVKAGQFGSFPVEASREPK